MDTTTDNTIELIAIVANIFIICTYSFPSESSSSLLSSLRSISYLCVYIYHNLSLYIQGNAQLRAMFMRMCLQMGVDPLQSKKAFWGELLGLGDFYYELAIQIIELCMAKRSDTGGLLDLDVLHSYIQKKRTRASTLPGDLSSAQHQQEQITVDDLIRSIRKLKVLNSGFDVVCIGGKQFLRSVPRELANDENEILEMVTIRIMMIFFLSLIVNTKC